MSMAQHHCLLRAFIKGQEKQGMLSKSSMSQKLRFILVQDVLPVVIEKLLNSDMVVFASPLYYYGMTAQLKTTIDRFCAFNSSLTHKHLKSALLSVAWNGDSWTFEALMAHYQTLVRYLNFDDQGLILGKGCCMSHMTRTSSYIEEAYELGKNIL